MDIENIRYESLAACPEADCAQESKLQHFLNNYTEVLGRMRRSDFPTIDDQYSGIFLPVAFDEYWAADFRIMHVGRETAGWNTRTGKNTLERIFTANEAGRTACIVDEAVLRYKKHLELTPDGAVKTRTRSRFKQYYFRLAKALSLPPRSIIYANLFAWDYAGKSPLTRPANELAAVSAVSLELLALQIKFFEPHAIVFSTGYAGIDELLKTLCRKYFGGHETINVDHGKLWELKLGNTYCFRIAHPRASWGHENYRVKTIDRLLEIRSKTIIPAILPCAIAVA